MDFLESPTFSFFVYIPLVLQALKHTLKMPDGRISECSSEDQDIYTKKLKTQGTPKSPKRFGRINMVVIQTGNVLIFSSGQKQSGRINRVDVRRGSTVL